jgi:hypothetical protein
MIAIHHRKNSFSDNWIAYCEEHSIAYKLVNCFSGNIIHEVGCCTALMWHWHHNDHKSTLFARQLTISLERKGINVFPNSNTSWHFDDKLGQKYLFDALDVESIQTYVFYEFQEALNWLKETSFPKVFKLRVGAGSEQVMLIKDIAQGRSVIKRAFSVGFPKKNRKNLLRERIWSFRRDKSFTSFINISRGLARMIFPTKPEKDFPFEKNYAYFQDFIPNNDHDIRVIVIGKRAFAIKRMVRKGDFRASGSGEIIHSSSQIPIECVRMAFKLSKKFLAQCVAFDFLHSNSKPLVVEISYSFTLSVYKDCPGYWDHKLNWISGKFKPEHFMIQDIIENQN